MSESLGEFFLSAIIAETQTLQGRPTTTPQITYKSDQVVPVLQGSIDPKDQPKAKGSDDFFGRLFSHLRSESGVIALAYPSLYDDAPKPLLRRFYAFRETAIEEVKGNDWLVTALNRGLEDLVIPFNQRLVNEPNVQEETFPEFPDVLNILGREYGLIPFENSEGMIQVIFVYYPPGMYEEDLRSLRSLATYIGDALEAYYAELRRRDQP